MIGYIDVEMAGRRLTVELTDDLRWRCRNTDLERLLNQAHPGEVPCGASPESVGRYLLYQVAGRLGGEVRFPAPPAAV